jgi:hypothetical protein
MAKSLASNFTSISNSFSFSSSINGVVSAPSQPPSSPMVYNKQVNRIISEASGEQPRSTSE